MSETIGIAQVLERLTSTGQTSRQIGAAIYGCTPESLSREELEPVSKALSHLKGKGEAIMVRDGTSIMWLANGHESKQKIVAAVKNETVPAEEADTAAHNLVAIAAALSAKGFGGVTPVDGVMALCDLYKTTQKSLNDAMRVLDKFGHANVLSFENAVPQIADVIEKICEENLAKNSAFPQEKRKPTKLELANLFVKSDYDPSEITELYEAILMLEGSGYKVVEDANPQAQA